MKVQGYVSDKYIKQMKKLRQLINTEKTKTNARMATQSYCYMTQLLTILYNCSDVNIEYRN